MSRVFAPLTAQGLSLHAVLDLASLPADVQASLALTPQERARYRQLILIGHQGRGFWQALQARGWHGSDPVDTFVGECIQAWMNGPLAGHAWVQVFPGPRPVGLQRLGELAGWHHPSPFWVGVDAEWGSWFAYRAVVLADTDLPLTLRRTLPSPCLDCSGQPCVAACPAQALSPIGAQGVDTDRLLQPVCGPASSTACSPARSVRTVASRARPARLVRSTGTTIHRWPTTTCSRCPPSGPGRPTPPDGAPLVNARAFAQANMSGWVRTRWSQMGWKCSQPM